MISVNTVKAYAKKFEGPCLDKSLQVKIINLPFNVPMGRLLFRKVCVFEGGKFYYVFVE